MTLLPKRSLRAEAGLDLDDRARRGQRELDSTVPGADPRPSLLDDGA